MAVSINSIINFISTFISLSVSLKFLVWLLIILLIAWILLLLKYLASSYLRIKFLNSRLFSLANSFTKNYFWHLQVIFLLMISLVLAFIFLPQPIICSPKIPLFNELSVTDQEPLEIKFTRPISRRIHAEISPPIPGEWKFTKNSKDSIFITNLYFYPLETLSADTEYQVKVEGIINLLFDNLSKKNNNLFIFKTPSLPDIKSVLPQENVKTNQPLEIKFTKTSQKNVEWSFELMPAVDVSLSFAPDRQTAWLEPREQFSQGETYEFKIYRTPVVLNYKNEKIIQRFDKNFYDKYSFKTVESPTIEEISPSGEPLLPQQSISIRFRIPMDQASVNDSISIKPSLSLNFIWENDSRLVIDPQEEWQLDTDYILTITKNARTTVGGYLQDDFLHHFKTIGPVKILSQAPAINTQDVKVDTPISITFDQPVNQADAQNKFSFTPETPGSFSWRENTLVFTPDRELEKSTTYQVILDPGIDSTYGLDSQESFQWYFSTISDTFSLEVPQYKQHYNFTCFSIAAKMALAYKGVNGIDELGFMNEIGYDQTPRHFVANTWGNPNQKVVGTLDGSHPGGYGTHWGPVSEVIEKYRPVEIRRNWNIKELLQAVHQGNPVLVWWINGVWPARDISWNTPDGERIYAVNGMHVEVVKGWVGDINNPKYILTNDPWRGNRRYTQSQFSNLWRWFDNTAVIVY